MVKVAILGGTGDVYLICALMKAFRAVHNRSAVVVVKGKHSCIPPMFGVPYEVDDAAIARAETDQTMQRSYDNVIVDDRYFYAHPCFQRTHVRMDWITAHPEASQADMYRLILQVPPDVPLDKPKLPPVSTVPNSVVLITQSTSWPNNQPAFWDLLALRLRQSGWHPIVNDWSWSLEQLLQHCANAEWVIGPQCGVMSILVTAEFPCRKTFVVANVDDNAAPGFVARQTYPYGYVTKFSNRNYDVEEFKVSAHDHDEVASLVVHGSNAMRLWRHNPNPMIVVNMTLAPGDFMDRYAILAVKRERFPLDKKAAIERDFQRHHEAFRQMPRTDEMDAAFEKLLELHRVTFDLLQTVVPSALVGALSVADHARAIRLNKERVDLKRSIDAMCSVPNSEIKSYYK